jgi:tRNA A-37 threonylcarbamoyl transferase component Bud32
MLETRRCPQCGTELSPDAPEGLCPKCLLRHGMDETIPAAGPSAAAGAKPTIRYFGDYELESEISRGGMGVVYKARQLTLNRLVAVKMILAGQLADDVSVDRFYAEAEAAANLKHPNIVAIHEVGQHEGQHYFSMDLIDGPSLAEWAAGRPTPPLQAAALVKTIAGAVHYAHLRGTLHRDLKPSNVLIDANDAPHITDFGLAKTSNAARNLTQTGDIMGTPAYMSPEQAAGRHDQIGPHSDVYALGAILYELLTGEPPFQADNPLTAMLNVIEADPVAPRTRNAAIPPDLEIICLKCLEKSPPRRYHSAGALAEDLERFIRREPIHARPASTVRKVASWIRRHPEILSAAVALAVAGLVAGVFYLAEENAFLRARQADPALTREPGPRIAALAAWNRAGLMLFIAAFAVGTWTVRATQRWRHAPADPNRWASPLQPAGRRLRVAATGLGLVTTAVSLMILVKSIQAVVWEGGPGAAAILMAAYPPGWVGLWLLALALQDYRLSTFGLLARPALTQARRDAIESQLVQAGRLSAIKLYRETFPGASLPEAKAYVDELDAAWQKRDPQGYAAAREPGGLNWPLMAACAVVQVAALYFRWPPSLMSYATNLGFAQGFVLGVVCAAMPRITLNRKRLAAAAVGIAVVFLAFVLIEEYTGNVRDYSAGSYALGIAFGAALLISAYTRRRRGGAEISYGPRALR